MAKTAVRDFSDTVGQFIASLHNIVTWSDKKRIFSDTVAVVAGAITVPLSALLARKYSISEDNVTVVCGTAIASLAAAAAYRITRAVARGGESIVLWAARSRRNGPSLD